MSKVIIVLVILFGLCGICAFIGALAQPTDTDSQATPTPTQVAVTVKPTENPVKTKNTYSAEVRKLWFDSCGKDNTCTCVLNRFEENFTQSEFVTLTISYAETGVLDSKMQDIMLSCL